MQINIKKQALRPGGFTEGKGRKKSLKSGMYSVDYNPSDETVVRMQYEIMYLRQEVEFLKNYFAKEYRQVRAALMGKAALRFDKEA